MAKSFRTIVNAGLLGTILGGAVLVSGAARAEEAEGPVSLSANVALVSDYRFRGISLSDKKPAVQGGFDLTYSITENFGLFLGNWNSSIEQFNGAETEIDIYGGVQGSLGAASYKLGLVGYIYPGGTNTNYLEIYGSVAGDLGPVNTTVGFAWAPDQDNYPDNIYVYGKVAYAIPETPVSVSAGLGYEDGAFDGKWDWNVGASYTFKQFTLSASYIDTNYSNPITESGRLGKATVVVSLAAAF
jgi:uncharacterized protein (TIGR02001 family)